MYETKLLIAEPDDGRAGALVEIVRILRPRAEPVRVVDSEAAIAALTGWARAEHVVECIILSEALGELGGRSVLKSVARLGGWLSGVPIIPFSASAADAVEQMDAEAEESVLAGALEDPYAQLVRQLGVSAS